MSGSPSGISSKKRGLTLAEVLLSAAMFLILMSSMFGLLTQSVRLLEPSSEDQMSEVLLLASRLRSDARRAESVEKVDETVVLTGTGESGAFTATYVPTPEGMTRSYSEGGATELQTFFLEEADFTFDTAGDVFNDGSGTVVVPNVMKVTFKVKFSQTERELVVKVAVPYDPPPPTP